MRNALRRPIGMFHWVNVWINVLINKIIILNLINASRKKSRLMYVIISNLFGILILTHASFVHRRLRCGIRRSRYASNVLLNIQCLIIRVANVVKKCARLDRNGMLLRLNAHLLRKNVLNMKITHFNSKNVSRNVRFMKFTIKHRIVVHI